jgi:hypothetical protein
LNGWSCSTKKARPSRTGLPCGRTGDRRRWSRASRPRSRRGRRGSAAAAAGSRSRSRRRSPARSRASRRGRSRTASAMTWADEWRIASSSPWAPASRSSSAEPRTTVSKKLAVPGSRRCRPFHLPCRRSWPHRCRQYISRKHKAPRPTGREASLAVPPAFTRAPGHPAPSCALHRSNGRIPDRLTGRSRVVSLAEGFAVALSHGARGGGSLGSSRRGVSRSTL